MRKILLVLLTLISTVSFSQVKVGGNGNIIPTGNYPAIFSKDIKGTIHSVQSIVDRNNITNIYREQGMMVFVKDSAKYYYLYPGVTNSDWNELKFGPNQSDLDSSIVKVEKLNDSIVRFYFKNNSRNPKDIQIKSYTDTTSLSNRINAKLSITDTTNKWVNYIFKKPNSDSVFYHRGGTNIFAFRDSTLKDTLYYTKKQVDSVIDATTVKDITWGVIDSVRDAPASPKQGDRYLVSISATGAFTGRQNLIATYDTTAGWSFQNAAAGDLLYNSTSYKTYKWTGTVWELRPPPLVENWWSRTAWNGAAGQFIQTGAKDSYLTMFGSFNGSSVGLGRQVFTGSPAGGNNNTAIGATSQYHNEAGGYNNTSVGSYSLWYNVGGHDQVAIGFQAAGAGNKVYSIGLGTNVKNENRQFSISDSTTKMYFRLDTSAGTPNYLVGRSSNGQWYSYPYSGSGIGGSYIPTSEKGANNGVATLDNGGKVPSSQLPALTVNQPSYVAHLSDMLALSASVGDIVVVGDSSKSYALMTTPASSFSNWLEIQSPVPTNTDLLPEGTTNKYYTDTRSRNAISAGSGINYNPSTGVISKKKPDWNASAGSDEEILNRPTIPAQLTPLGSNTIEISGTYPILTWNTKNIYKIAQTDSIVNQLRSEITTAAGGGVTLSQLDSANNVTRGQLADTSALLRSLRGIDSITVINDSLFAWSNGVKTFFQTKNVMTVRDRTGFYGLSYVGGITLTEDSIKITGPVYYSLGIPNVSYRANDSTFHVPFATTNYYRTDLITANSSGHYTYTQGTEQLNSSTAPALPTSSIIIAMVQVYGDSIINSTNGTTETFWSPKGNIVYDSAYLGTINNKDLNFITNNRVRQKIDSSTGVVTFNQKAQYSWANRNVGDWNDSTLVDKKFVDSSIASSSPTLQDILNRGDYDPMANTYSNTAFNQSLILKDTSFYYPNQIGLSRRLGSEYYTLTSEIDPAWKIGYLQFNVRDTTSGHDRSHYLKFPSKAKGTSGSIQNIFPYGNGILATSATVNGTTYNADSLGNINLGTISGGSGSWSLSGNNVTSGDFIGSNTSTSPIVVKVAGDTTALFSQYDVKIGKVSDFSLSGYNVNVGGGQNSNAKFGMWSSTLGWAALRKITDPYAVNNIAIGAYSLASLTSGNNNIGLGVSAGGSYDFTANNTLFIADSTYHLKMRLDSSAGSSPNVVGIDSNGYWHKYVIPAGTTIPNGTGFLKNNGSGTWSYDNSTYAVTGHTHSAADITSGVLAIGRIPTGTTSTTVSLGNHTHTFASLTSKPTTISGYGITDFNSLGDARWKALSYVPAWSEITSKPTFATVATTGSYNDLTNKPTIPSAQVNSDWNSASGVTQILNKPTNLVTTDGTQTITGTKTFNATKTNFNNVVAFPLMGVGSGGNAYVNQFIDISSGIGGFGFNGWYNPSTSQYEYINTSAWGGRAAILEVHPTTGLKLKIASNVANPAIFNTKFSVDTIGNISGSGLKLTGLTSPGAGLGFVRIGGDGTVYLRTQAETMSDLGVNLKVNYSDTASMLAPLWSKINTTDTVSTKSPLHVMDSSGVKQILYIDTASASKDGILLKGDWSTFNGKQAALVSGTNIKTINGNSILGSGDLSISGGATNLALGTTTSTTQPITNSNGTGFTLPSATTSNAGLMSGADKQMLTTRQGRINSVYQTIATFGTTLTLADTSKLFADNITTSIGTYEVPPNSSVAFPINTQITFAQMGNFQTAIVAGSGVTIVSTDNALKTLKKGSTMTLIKVATDTWLLTGSITN